MSGKLPPYPVDNEATLKLDQAHKSLHMVNQAYKDELNEAIRRVDLKHAPFLYTAQSVLYEAMSEAAIAGFDAEEQAQIMGCAMH